LRERVGVREAEGVIRYVPHLVGDGARILEQACKLGVEGIVAKRLSAPHMDGRSKNWLKLKCERVAPFVVGGFTASGAAVSALLVDCYDARGQLVFAGSVGTGKGFTRELLQGLRTQLVRIEQQSSPFAGFSPKTLKSPWGQRRAAPTHWVHPLLVVQVAFTGVDRRWITAPSVLPWLQRRTSPQRGLRYSTARAEQLTTQMRPVAERDGRALRRRRTHS
jgi:bifunctional non-homologous end joining protein LigD